MKTLKRILQELNYGKQLFGSSRADVLKLQPKASSRYTAFLQSIGAKTEPDTEEERELFDTVVRYLALPSQVNDLTPLSELLPLKSKFPLMLDPLQDREVNNDGYVYRGATVDTKNLIALVKAAKLDWSKGDVSDFASISTNGKTVNSRSTRGALSFTFERRTAETFATVMKHRTSIADLAQRYPVVLQCSINTVKDKLLFTPSFLNAVSDYGENETFYFDTQIPCDKILIAPPMAFDSLGSPSQVAKNLNKYPSILQQLIKAVNYIQS